MNLILNNGIAEHKNVETTMIQSGVVKGKVVSEVRQMRFEFLQKAIFIRKWQDGEWLFKTPQVSPEQTDWRMIVIQIKIT
jgi:hypothetical protein